MERPEPYRPWPIGEQAPLDLETILSGSLDEELVRRVRAIVEAEAPVTRGLLLKRLVNSCGMAKVGRRLEERFSIVLSNSGLAEADEEGVIVYHSNSEDREVYRPLGEEGRYSEQIPPSEALNCVVHCLSEAGRKVRRGQLYRDFLARLGYSKSGSDLAELYSRALALGEKCGRIQASANGWLWL